MADRDHPFAALAGSDPLIADALGAEIDRQQNTIELIASENIVSRAVLEALGSTVNNKTLEGYPGARFHGGGGNVDIAERAAIERARELFGCEYVNVQPHSGSQANLAVFFALLRPGDRVLSLDLAAGGHLSHGSTWNLSGSWFDVAHYGIDRTSGLIDYAGLEETAEKFQPRLLIAGGSAYPRIIDFPRMAAIARRVGALFLVDMAHIAGLVAAGVHPSPLPHADVVTATTTKTLRGPRGGLLLSRDTKFEKVLNDAVFPGVQGSLHPQVIAAKAVCLGEALEPGFKAYGQRVVANARTLADELDARGIGLVGGGTDTHMLLLDLKSKETRGKVVQDRLASIGITSNSNPVHGDGHRPGEWTGLRLGTAAATTRGLGKAEFELLGGVVADVVESAGQDDIDRTLNGAAAAVAELCRRYPAYPVSP